jgi:DNA-binding response OmpR family regulator
MPRKISIVEDEAELAALIEYNLRREGYQTQVLPGLKDTLRQLEAWKPDLILLDIMLPEINGFDLCRQIRASASLLHTPVLFLTARSEEVDRVLGLEIGGDDYMTKPFSPRELLARVRAHLRGTETSQEVDTVEIGPFRLDRRGHRLCLNGSEVHLTFTEFKLVELFLTHSGRAFSRQQILDMVWGDDRFLTPRTVDVHVRRLREQIEPQPENPRYLLTVRGFGYRFTDASEAASEG